MKDRLDQAQLWCILFLFYVRYFCLFNLFFVSCLESSDSEIGSYINQIKSINLFEHKLKVQEDFQITHYWQTTTSFWTRHRTSLDLEGPCTHRHPICLMSRLSLFLPIQTFSYYGHHELMTFFRFYLTREQAKVCSWKLHCPLSNESSCIVNDVTV